jgi:hypothetical protein
MRINGGISMKNFIAFHGTITMIQDFRVDASEASTGCYKIMSLVSDDGNLVNFVVSPSTYFVDHAMVIIGDRVTGFYDANVPVPLIYPPQYQAIVMAKDTIYQNVKVDYFNSQLISSDGQLKLNLSPYTPILLPNDQAFALPPANRYLIVTYGPTTKSIPAQTTPYKIVVLC